MSKYSNDLDGELDRLVFLHEDRSPNPSDWCCLREPSVREAVKELLEQTRTNTIDAAIAVLPEKRTIDTIHEYDANTFNKGVNQGIKEAKANILKLKKG